VNCIFGKDDITVFAANGAQSDDLNWDDCMRSQEQKLGN
jgi:hypothetical protein